MTKLSKITTFGIVIAVLVAGGLSIWFSNPNRKIRNEIMENGCDQSATTTDCAELIKNARESEVFSIPISPATSYTEVASTTQSGKIDEHLTIDNTFINVTFCDKVLKSRQIFIDGVDVVQRIAYLATNELTEQKGFANTTFGQAICNSMPYNLYTKGVLETADVTIFTDNDAGFSKMPGKTYAVFLSARQFFINPSMNAIFSIGGYGGEWTNIGTLK